MKILFYIYSLNKGGAERVLLTLAEKLNMDINTEAVILTDAVDEREYSLPAGVRRINLSEYLSAGAIRHIGYVNRLLAIKKCVKEEAPDKIVAFMTSGAIRAIQAGMIGRFKVISAIRSNPFDDYRTARKRHHVNRILSHSEHIVCQTEFQKEFFLDELQKKCSVIFNPIFDDFIVEPFMGERDKTIVATGRLFDYKNHKMLIRAFAKIASKYPDYKVIIYGEGPYRSELEDEVSILGKQYGLELSKQILLPGDSSDVANDICKAGLYVLPSLTEGMPNALMEAMALGLPVIATDCPCGGPRSLIRDGVNGILVPVDDVDTLSKEMDRLLSDGDLRKSLGQEALKIREDCSADKITDQWRHILNA